MTKKLLMCFILALVLALTSCITGNNYEPEQDDTHEQEETPQPTLQPTPIQPEPTPPPIAQYPTEDDLEPPIPITLTHPSVRWVVEPIHDFDAVFDFSDGMAAVEIYDRTRPAYFGDYEHVLGYMNRLGEIIIPIEFRHWPGFYSHRGAPPFAQGLVAVQSNEHGGVGIFNTEGTLVVPFYFSDAHSFSEGLLAVRAPNYQDGYGDWANDGWGFIDTTGELVIPFQFDYASSFSNGRAAVLRGEDMLWGFIDHAGVLVIPHQFNFLSGQADSFFLPQFSSSGLVCINIGGFCAYEDIEWVHIDLAGNIVGSCERRSAWDTCYAMDTVSSDEPALFIISNTEPPMWTRSYFCTDAGHEITRDGETGEIWVDDRLWGLADIDGNIVVPTEFCEIRNFSEGLAWVRQGRFWGIIEFM